MPFNPNDANPYKQKRDGNNANQSKQNIMIYRCLSPQRTLIQSHKQQYKTIKNPQETFELTLSRMQLLIYQEHQNKMSNLSLS